MSILITGANGFIGRHLIQALKNAQKDPYSQQLIIGIDNCYSSELGIPFFKVDLTDARSTERIIRKLKPRQIYHLAGYSSNARSFQEPAQAIIQNISLANNLLYSVARLNSACRVLMVSTMQVYGNVKGRLTETTEPRPLSPYAMSKLAMEEIGRFYHRNFGLEVILVRAGNQIGPGQSPEYVASGFARQIMEIKQGRRPAELKVGNLKVRRDFLDVRDSVRGYLLLMEKGKAGEIYHLARGKNIMIVELLDKMLELAGLDKRKLKISVSLARLRPEPEEEQIISIHKIQKLGFRAEIPLEKTLKDLLEDWRTRLEFKRLFSNLVPLPLRGGD